MFIFKDHHWAPSAFTFYTIFPHRSIRWTLTSSTDCIWPDAQICTALRSWSEKRQKMTDLRIRLKVCGRSLVLHKVCLRHPALNFQGDKDPVRPLVSSGADVGMSRRLQVLFILKGVPVCAPHEHSMELLALGTGASSCWSSVWSRSWRETVMLQHTNTFCTNGCDCKGCTYFWLSILSVQSHFPLLNSWSWTCSILAA